MLGNALKKISNTLNAGITAGISGVKTLVNNLNENRPLISINQKKYYQGNLIAEGGYAMIYKIQSESDGKEYALKRIVIQSSSHKKQIKKEIKFWKQLSKYQNIVELKDFEFTEKNVYLVMEFCPEGTLLDLVNNHNGNISENEAIIIFNQILLGINAMHSQKPPIAHRDLKIENILKSGKIYKLCDFGSASDEIFDPKNSDEFIKEENFSNFEKNTTLYYRPPEMCDRYGENVVSEKVDIWALGCVLYTMVFKEQPFMNSQKLEIINANYNFPKEEQSLYSEKFLDLIRVMLSPNPNDRPNVIQIMEWTNFWNEVKNIPLSSDVEKIKSKQIESGGSKKKSQKKKLLTKDEIIKIQSKLKNKEKSQNHKKDNTQEINELFGFTNNNNQKNNNSNNNSNNKEKTNQGANNDLMDMFAGQPQTQTNNKKEDNDLLDMEFYEVDESNQNVPNNNNTNNNNILDMFSNNTNNNNSSNNAKVENKKAANNANDFDSLFGGNTSANNNNNNTDNKKSTNDFDAFFGGNTSNNNNNNNDNKKSTSDFDAFFGPNIANTNNNTTSNSNNNVINDLFGNANGSSNTNNNTNNNNNNINDLFGNSTTKPSNNNNNNFDLFADMNNTTNSKTANNVQMNGQNIFSNFPTSSQSTNQKKEDDLFADFNTPQQNTNTNSGNNDLLDGIFSGNKNNDNKTVGNEKKNDGFDILNMGNKAQSNNVSNKNNNNLNTDFMNLNLGNSKAFNMENGQPNKNENSSLDNSASQQDILNFF